MSLGPHGFLSKLMLSKKAISCFVVSSQHEGTRYRIEVIRQIPPTQKNAEWFISCVVLVCV